MKLIDWCEKCDNCKHYYYDGRYDDYWCMIRECPNVPDEECQFCKDCKFLKECMRDYEKEKENGNNLQN